MGPKYEFTDETINYDGRLLHRIRRLSDGKIGGWIESEKNLSQEGDCWVDGNAKVYDDAEVYGNARVFNWANVYDNAKIYDTAHVYGEAVVNGNAQVYGNAYVIGDTHAHVYSNAQVYGNAYVSGDATVYGNAQIYGNASVCGNAQVFGYIKISSGRYTSGYYYYCDEDLSNDSSKEVIKDFIYKVNDSNKITAQTEYDSIDEFFNEPITNDIKLDTLVICTIDTKEPLIKLQKVETDNKTEFKFIVDITNEDGDDFIFRSIIKSQEQQNQLIHQTIEALKNYPQFSKYADDLENCL